MSCRRHDPQVLAKFLAPAAGFFVAFVPIPVRGLFTGGTITVFSVASTLNIVSVSIAASALLVLRGAAVAEDAGENLA